MVYRLRYKGIRLSKEKKSRILNHSEYGKHVVVYFVEEDLRFSWQFLAARAIREFRYKVSSDWKMNILRK